MEAEVEGNEAKDKKKVEKNVIIKESCFIRIFLMSYFYSNESDK